MCTFELGRLKGRYYLEDIGIDEMIIVNESSINGE
jgi:hypothetical protein